jgi:hypothetical protein
VLPAVADLDVDLAPAGSCTADPQASSPVGGYGPVLAKAHWNRGVADDASIGRVGLRAPVTRFLLHSPPRRARRETVIRQPPSSATLTTVSGSLFPAVQRRHYRLLVLVHQQRARLPPSATRIEADLARGEAHVMLKCP